MKPWTGRLGLARGALLLLPATLVASGAGAASYAYALDWRRTILSLLGLLALQSAASALDEASGQRARIDHGSRRAPIPGGNGTPPAGPLTPRVAFLLGLGLAGVGLAIGLVLLLEVGPVLLPILVLGAVCVLAYADVLSRRGLGELAAGLGLGALPVLGAALVQNGTAPVEAFGAAAPAFLLSFDLLLLVELHEDDALAKRGRRHLGTLLGRRGGALVYATAALLVPASIAVAVAAKALPSACLFAAIPSLLLVPPLRWALADPARPVPAGALRACLAWTLSTNAALAAALFLSSGA